MPLAHRKQVTLMQRGWVTIASLVTALASPVQSAPPAAPITVTGHAWAPFISPMGEPFRVRAAGDDPFLRWFRAADRNQDGALTSDEMQADASRFFAILDSDHDGEIGPDELVAYEWEVAPEIQVNSKWRRSPGAAGGSPSGEKHDGTYGGSDDSLQGAARYALLNMPEPVAAADADLNRAITPGEFRQAAAYRFALLDSRHAGRLTQSELQALLPPPPAPGRRARHRDNEIDARIGVPLPGRD